MAKGRSAAIPIPITPAANRAPNPNPGRLRTAESAGLLDHTLATLHDVKRTLALAILILGAKLTWAKSEGAGNPQEAPSLRHEKVQVEASNSLDPSIAGRVQQAKTYEVLTVLEQEFAIRARWGDLGEKDADWRLSEKLATLHQIRSAKKDEFETTVEFQARRAGLVSNPVLNTNQIILLPQSANSTYDADAETLRVGLPLVLFGGPSDSERSRRKVRAFAGDFPKDYFGDAIFLVDLKIPRDQARQLKANLRLLLLARLPSPEAPVEEWATESGETLLLIPTAILAFSASDGAVVHRQTLRQPAETRKPADQQISGDLRPQVDPRRSQPRPQLVKTIQTRPAILAENKFGTTNIGPTAVDARWSNYGAYLQRMIDSVQIQWERIVIEQKANPVGGSSVTVKFVMNDEGRIVDIGVENSTANDTATRACVSAITDRMPYGRWTDDMKAVLGDRQQMTFTFYYQ